MVFIHFYSVFISVFLLNNIAVCIRVFKIAAIVTDKPDGHRQTRHRQKAVTAGASGAIVDDLAAFLRHLGRMARQEAKGRQNQKHGRRSWSKRDGGRFPRRMMADIADR